MSKEEKEFLQILAEYCKYWGNPELNIENAKYENDYECRINGFIHSLLTLFRGSSSANGFRYYRLYKGRGNKELGLNEYLPSRYFEIYRKLQEVINAKNNQSKKDN